MPYYDVLHCQQNFHVLILVPATDGCDHLVSVKLLNNLQALVILQMCPNYKLYLFILWNSTSNGKHVISKLQTNEQQQHWYYFLLVCGNNIYMHSHICTHIYAVIYMHSHIHKHVSHTKKPTLQKHFVDHRYSYRIIYILS